MDDYMEIREQLVTACKRAYHRGIQTGSGGNVSARVPGQDKMILKASGSSFEDSTVEGFVITDFDGNKLSGAGKPTREALLHGLIYRRRPDVDAVVHVHSPYAVGWACTRKPLPRVTWHAKLKICGDLPTLDIPAAMVRQEDFPVVERMLEEYPEIPAFLLVDHGVVAMAKDAINAEHLAELVEETAQIAFLEAIAKKLAL